MFNKFHPIKFLKNTKFFIIGLIGFCCIVVDFYFYRNSLNYIHFLFFILSIILLSINNRTLYNIIYLFKKLKINKIKTQNVEIEIDNRTSNLKKQIENNKNISTNNIKISSAEIEELHSLEVQYATLRYLLNDIDVKLRNIYYRVYSKLPEYVSVDCIESIVIFEKLKRDEILNQDFMALIYEFCAITNKLLYNSYTISTINDLTAIDLVAIGNDLSLRLDSVDKYLDKQQEIQQDSRH